jgi:hypothetical protein
LWLFFLCKAPKIPLLPSLSSSRQIVDFALFFGRHSVVYKGIGRFFSVVQRNRRAPPGNLAEAERRDL